MPYAVYKSRHVLTVSPGDTVTFDSELGRIPDQVYVEPVSGDAVLQFGTWTDQGTVEVTNPGTLEVEVKIYCEWTHSLTR